MRSLDDVLKNENEISNMYVILALNVQQLLALQSVTYSESDYHRDICPEPIFSRRPKYIFSVKHLLNFYLFFTTDNKIYYKFLIEWILNQTFFVLFLSVLNLDLVLYTLNSIECRRFSFPYFFNVFFTCISIYFF